MVSREYRERSEHKKNLDVESRFFLCLYDFQRFGCVRDLVASGIQQSFAQGAGLLLQALGVLWAGPE